MARLVSLILAYFFLALAVIGAFLPLMPTVPFLILSALLSVKGSKKLHQWLYSHPHLGKMLIDWEQRKAIARKSKIVSILMLMISWIGIYFQIQNIWVIVSVSVLFIVVATFIVTRAE